MNVATYLPIRRKKVFEFASFLDRQGRERNHALCKRLYFFLQRFVVKALQAFTLYIEKHCRQREWTIRHVLAPLLNFLANDYRITASWEGKRCKADVPLASDPEIVSIKFFEITHLWTKLLSSKITLHSLSNGALEGGAHRVRVPVLYHAFTLSGSNKRIASDKQNKGKQKRERNKGGKMSYT